MVGGNVNGRLPRLFTSESVTEGHPDKVADQISDAVLDALLKDDPYSRVAVETFAITGQIHIAGEVTTKTYIDIPRIVRETIAEIGYTKSAVGFDAETCGVSVSIDEQSPDIAMGVDKSLEAKGGRDDEFEQTGAGDQGMMFGYACRETAELMPLPIVLAHNLTRHLAAVRKNGDIPYLRPDGKSQVTVEYDGDRPVRVDAVVISTQHDPDIPLEVIRNEVTDKVIKHVIPGAMFDRNTRVYVNPTGRFVIGGPKGDAGLTGRKIIADTYGGMARHGGGAFSGKDPTKVDRSAAYAARWVAKNVVAAGLADRCEVAGCLCDRRRRTDERARRDVRHGEDPRRADRQSGQASLRSASGGDHPLPQPAPPDLQANGGVRPLRTSRSRPAVGAARSNRGAAQRDRLHRRGAARSELRAMNILAALATVVLGVTTLTQPTTLKAGTKIACVMQTAVDSRTAQAGDTFTLSVNDPSQPVACRRASFKGHITHVYQPHGFERAEIAFLFDTIVSRTGRKGTDSSVCASRATSCSAMPRAQAHRYLRRDRSRMPNTVGPPNQSTMVWSMTHDLGGGGSKIAGTDRANRRLCVRRRSEVSRSSCKQARR